MVMKKLFILFSVGFNQNTINETQNYLFEREEQVSVEQMKEENENISFNYHLQFLVLVITEMRIQLHKYQTTSILLTFSSNFLLILACSFLCVRISSNKLNNISCHIC